MSARETGGPAFPAEGGSDSGLHAHPGMTLRDWFAGQALTGLIAGPRTNAKTNVEYAKAAYAVADAMLDARDEKAPAKKKARQP